MSSQPPGYTPLQEPSTHNKDANFASAPPPPYDDPSHSYSGGPSSVNRTIITVNTQPQPAVNSQIVVLGGGCPSCRIGVLRKSHCTCCGVFWSIVLFPIGLLCLCCCTKYRCTNCSYSQ